MFKYTLIRLFSLHLFLSNVLIKITAAEWQLDQELFNRLKAACEDQYFPVNPHHSSRLEPPPKNSDSLISQYPTPQIYAGWQPPSLPLSEASTSDQLFHGSNPAPAIFDIILKRLSDSRVSPAERLADYRKIETLWGQIPLAYRMEDQRWRSFLFFGKLSAIRKGGGDVSPDFKTVILNYLSRDRAKPLATESISGLTDALGSSNPFEKELAQHLQIHILVEDSGQ